MMKGDVAPQESYIHSLDLLRGFAALSVCLYHTGFLLMPGYHILPGGYLCVDLFFLLSGFVIARTYDRRIASGMVLGAFAIQRLARLYPLFLSPRWSDFSPPTRTFMKSCTPSAAPKPFSR